MAADHIRLWKLLRQPFPLTPSGRAYHACRYEAIDINIYGCVLCSNIHHCGPDVCQTCETEDAHVCVLSGIVVSKRISNGSDEFTDTVLHPENLSMRSGDPTKTAHFDMMHGFIDELLLSATAHKTHAYEVSRMTTKLCDDMVSRYQECDDALTAFEQAWGVCKARFPVTVGFHANLREAVAVECKRHVRYAMSTCCSFFRLNVKQHELRNTVFGLLYLMKQGIRYQECQILAEVPELKFLLPLESSLDKFFKFRPKYITDIENKCKYMFRSQKNHTQIKSESMQVR